MTTLFEQQGVQYEIQGDYRLNMMCHTIATYFRADPIDRRELRGYAIDEVKRTNGQISFGNALDAQRRLSEDDWQD